MRKSRQILYLAHSAVNTSQSSTHEATEEGLCASKPRGGMACDKLKCEICEVAFIRRGADRVVTVRKTFSPQLLKISWGFLPLGNSESSQHEPYVT